jgi:hypothetical protein
MDQQETESLERQFVRWIYRDNTYEHMTFKPQNLEPRRRPTGPLPPINRVLFALTGAGCDWRPSTTDVDSWQAQCPTHEDTRPSLLVRRNGDGSVWLKCWAGCSKEGVLAALGLEWRDLWDAAERDSGRRDVKPPLLPGHLRRAMEMLIGADDERRAA